MTIQSVNRALEILSLFSNVRPILGITEISKHMELPKPTVHGLVQTLLNQGFLMRDPLTKKYSLGLKIYELGVFLSDTIKINRMGKEAVKRLAVQSGCMTRIGIWDNQSILVTMNYLPDFETVRLKQLGPRVPAYCSAMGKAVLSTLESSEVDDYFKNNRLRSFTDYTLIKEEKLREELKEAQKKGVAFECEEYLYGMACIAVPIYDDSGKAVAGLSISGGKELLDEPELKNLISMVKNTSMEISGYMGFMQ